jgi:probable F420-dependent oxidoreductase
MKIRFAVSPGIGSFDADAMVRFATASERLGFDTIWLSDVPLAAVGDPIVSLSHVAARTTTLKLGANIVPIGRNPMVLARQLAQLDQLSAGRLLLTLVPGVDQPGERRALGFPRGDRGALVEEIAELLRRWWSGETVEHHSDQFDFAGIAVAPVPVQEPLELWFAGTGPKALDRVARAGDGWLTAALTPDEAGRGRETIVASMARYGRTIDDEHFGISLPFARTEVPATAVEQMRSRRPDHDLTDIAPVGADELAKLLQRHIDNGLSKFVLRPLQSGPIEDELAWLADVVLPLQT